MRNLQTVWHTISPDRIRPEDFVAVIEIPAGSRNKYELDKDSGHIILDRILHTATHYPANYGFLPRTLGDDGDPLDVLVLCAEPLLPLSLVQCHPLGLIAMQDNGHGDEKIIAVPQFDPNYCFYQELSDLPPHVMTEMQHFFTIYKALEGKQTVVDEVRPRAEAERIIAQCRRRYQEKFG